MKIGFIIIFVFLNNVFLNYHWKEAFWNIIGMFVFLTDEDLYNIVLLLWHILS